MGGHFHHRSTTTLSQNAGQHPVGLHDVGRGVGSGLQRTGHAVTKRPKDTARRSGVFQQRRNVLADRRFAVGAGHANQTQTLGRVLKEPIGDLAQTVTQADHWYHQGTMKFRTFARLRRFQQYHRRACGDGLFNVMICRRLGAGESDKGIPGLYRSAVRFEPVNGHVEHRRHGHSSL